MSSDELKDDEDDDDEDPEGLWEPANVFFSDCLVKNVVAGCYTTLDNEGRRGVLLRMNSHSIDESITLYRMDVERLARFCQAWLAIQDE